jgi:hypothetical protein
MAAVLKNHAVDPMAAMEEPVAMKRMAMLAILAAFGGLLFTAAPGVAQPAGVSTEESIVPQKRPRTRLRVRPIYPYRHFHSLYPPPYDIEYPGPNGKRECVDAYVTEHRPSGTVIVPRMRCRWVRG